MDGVWIYTKNHESWKKKRFSITRHRKSVGGPSFQDSSRQGS